jgi:nitroreductase
MVMKTLPKRSAFQPGHTLDRMEFAEVVRRRKMVRAFEDRPVDPAAIDRILRAGLRAPSAGFTQGWAFLVLEGADQVGQFWDASWANDEARASFQWPGLFTAPAIVVPLAHKQAYLDRYAERDKGIADRRESFWPVPYWHIDTGFAAMSMLLAAVDDGLGALFFGVFADSIDRVRAAFGIPAAYMPIGAIAIGHPAPGDRPSASLKRGQRPWDEVIHRGHW